MKLKKVKDNPLLEAPLEDIWWRPNEGDLALIRGQVDRMRASHHRENYYADLLFVLDYFKVGHGLQPEDKEWFLHQLHAGKADIMFGHAANLAKL